MIAAMTESLSASSDPIADARIVGHQAPSSDGGMTMGPVNFAAACREERDLMLADYANASGQSAVVALLAEANLSQEQKGLVVSAIDTALTDAFYTVLLAIDGSASLGQTQQSFILTDSDGNMIANGDGRLEAAAWEALQSNR